MFPVERIFAFVAPTTPPEAKYYYYETGKVTTL